MTNTKDYTNHVHIDAPAERVFELLTTAAEFAAWWAPAAGSAAEGGELRITFEGLEDPLVLTVSAAARPTTVIWEVEACGFLPDWVGTRPVFTLTETLSEGEPATGGCDVRFRHEGLSPRLECYDMCRAGWDQYLPSLRDYIETGTGTPFGLDRRG